jgi:hypothetical protein
VEAFVVVLAAVVLAAAIAVPVMRNAAAIIDARSLFNVFPSFLAKIQPVRNERRSRITRRDARMFRLPGTTCLCRPGSGK